MFGVEAEGVRGLEGLGFGLRDMVSPLVLKTLKTQLPEKPENAHVDP